MDIISFILAAIGLFGRVKGCSLAGLVLGIIGLCLLFLLPSSNPFNLSEKAFALSTLFSFTGYIATIIMASIGLKRGR